MRAWGLAAGLSVMLSASALAATRVTIQELKAYPDLYYGQTVLVECYYDKESPIWVRALPDADEWIGFFVTGKPDKALTWSGEYYNLLFAPYAMRETVRSLRGGDKITLIGEVFRYPSASLEGAGIYVQQLLQGWGPSAKAIGAVSVPSAPPASAGSVAAPVMGRPSPTTESSLLPVSVLEKYTVTINGKRYQGLRVGDPYNLDGINFQVDRSQ